VLAQRLQLAVLHLAVRAAVLPNLETGQLSAFDLAVAVLVEVVGELLVAVRELLLAVDVKLAEQFLAAGDLAVVVHVPDQQAVAAVLGEPLGLLTGFVLAVVVNRQTTSTVDVTHVHSGYNTWTQRDLVGWQNHYNTNLCGGWFSGQYAYAGAYVWPNSGWNNPGSGNPGGPGGPGPGGPLDGGDVVLR